MAIHSISSLCSQGKNTYSRQINMAESDCWISTLPHTAKRWSTERRLRDEQIVAMLAEP